MSLLKFLAAGALLLLPASVVAADAKPFILTCLEIPDVQRGAGLAIVLQLPSGKTCLYDTGSGYSDSTSLDGWQERYNAGRDLFVPFPTIAGVKEIDTVIISHAHYDHFGGLVWLNGRLPIKRLVDAGYTYRGKASKEYGTALNDYEKLRADFKGRGAYLEAPNRGLSPTRSGVAGGGRSAVEGVLDPTVSRASQPEGPSRALSGKCQFAGLTDHTREVGVLAPW